MTAAGRTIRNLIRPLVPKPFLERLRAWRWQRFLKARGIAVRYKSDTIEVCRGESILRIARRHEVYVTDMVAYFDYYYGSVQADGNVVDFSGPRRHRLIGFDDFPVLFPSIPEPYTTLKQYLDFASLRPGAVVLDLGAYAGVTSVVFAREVGPTGEVFAFEPDAGNFQAATENVNTARSFGYPLVTLINEAVWRHNDGLDFSAEGAMGSSAASIAGVGRGSIVRVPTTTLARFFRERRLSRIDFIKMDIEGAEVEALDSSRELLRQTRPKLMIEPHVVAEVLTTKRCCRILREIGGYEVRVVDQLGVSIPLIEATPVARG